MVLASPKLTSICNPKIGRQPMNTPIASPQAWWRGLPSWRRIQVIALRRFWCNLRRQIRKGRQRPPNTFVLAGPTGRAGGRDWL
jgi:hypothetical protein